MFKMVEFRKKTISKKTYETEWNYGTITDFLMQYYKNYPQLIFYRCFLQDDRAL